MLYVSASVFALLVCLDEPVSCAVCLASCAVCSLLCPHFKGRLPYLIPATVTALFSLYFLHPALGFALATTAFAAGVYTSAGERATYAPALLFLSACAVAAAAPFAGAYMPFTPMPSLPRSVFAALSPVCAFRGHKGIHGLLGTLAAIPPALCVMLFYHPAVTNSALMLTVPALISGILYSVRE